MILSKLHLENFKKYTKYEIEFEEGLIGIIGKNGSGKSTIFEAILFALYGELKNRGAKEVIRNANATTKDAVVVELCFEFEGLLYRIVREFRGKSLSANAKLYKNEELITSGAKEVTASIIQLTKMSRDAFMHTLFASQKELTSLSTLKNEDRKKMIRKLLGLQKIDFIEKELVEKSRELKREIAAFNEILLSEDDTNSKKTALKKLKANKKELQENEKKHRQELASLKEIGSVLKKELEIFTQTKEKKQKASTAIQLLKNSIISQQASQKKLQQELKTLEQKAQELKRNAAVKAEYAALDKELKEQEKLKEIQLKKEGLQKEQTQLRDQYTKALNDIKELEKECALYDTLPTQEKKLYEDVEKIKKELLQTQQKERELSEKLSAEQRVVSDTNKKIQSIQNLGRDSACPTCTRPLLEEYDNVINTLQNTINELQNTKIQGYTKELLELRNILSQKEQESKKAEKDFQTLTGKILLQKSKQKDLQNAQKYFQTINQKGLNNKAELQTLQDYSYDAKAHKQLQEKLDATKPKYEYVLSLEVQLQRVTPMQEELQRLTQLLQTNIEQLKAKETAFELIDYDVKKHETKLIEYETVQKEEEQKTKQIHEIQVNIATYEGEANTIEAMLKNNQTQLEKVQTKKDDLKDYEKIKHSLIEFKTKLNAKIAPRISSTASSMYSQITKGKYQHIEVNNDFDFFIYDEGKKYPIERYSGGEIDLANLVLRIAISKTLTELSGANSIGFLAFDEVFGSQDESRRIEILEAFHTIKEQYRQIFLISHDMEIKEMFEKVVEL
ncbi:SMC family ATPase [Sulfurimonas sp.]|uniref:AAA family ATPase n=1 Tax=Sulfurimonas sp. TaxID=2022749 RepID=UPI00261F34E4|nr:SMC family ATPase [Sulfurimonas sp.]